MRRNVLLITLVAAWSCLLHGCHAKQKDWHSRVDRGRSAVVYPRYPTTPLLVGKQLIATIGSEPDFTVRALEFPQLFAEGDAVRDSVMNHIWTVYFKAKQKLRQELQCVKGPNKWQDCEEFKECTLWVYDESVHFSKPLYSGDWLHCLLCAQPEFRTVLFFVEQKQVIGAIGIGHDKPLTKRSE